MDMGSNHWWTRTSWLAAALIGATFTACTDETVIYRDRELFEEPLPAAARMLGYSDIESGQTVCGSCHIDAQTKWSKTAHADAWAGLQDSGHAQEFCEGCHTVNELGNSLTSAAGYTATGEDRYHDVQCESCHGPGLDHVTNPMDSNVPLASMLASTDATNGCGECHSGAHHPFADEWSQSGHGSVLAYPADRGGSCDACHTGEGALRAWGVTDPYTEDGSLDGPGQHMAITCAVCHDPHGSDHSAQLRFAIDVPSEDENLCMKCHHKRGGPELTSPQRGPHSPQGPLLLGEAGWIPPNLELPAGGVLATHGTEANPRLCAGCHVNSYTVSDEATGEFVFEATGHLFLATPCVDAQGVPVPGDCDDSERQYQGCATSGCHGSPTAARSALFVAQTRLNTLADELDVLLATVPEAEFDPADGRYSTAEGAKFNAALARFSGTAAHNPFLTEALLIASIRQVEADYGMAASATLSLDRALISDGALQ